MTVQFDEQIPESITITTDSPEGTRRLGETIGRRLYQKTIISLSGDLGAGKTVFVQGLARGLDVPPDYYVTSPTYTLVNEYPGRRSLIHADLYRIAGGTAGASELEDIGFEQFYDTDGVIVVEWADRLPPGALAEDFSVSITMVDDSTRDFILFFYGRKKTNLIQHLKKTFETSKR